MPLGKDQIIGLTLLALGVVDVAAIDVLLVPKFVGAPEDQRPLAHAHPTQTSDATGDLKLVSQHAEPKGVPAEPPTPVDRPDGTRPVEQTAAVADAEPPSGQPSLQDEPGAPSRESPGQGPEVNPEPERVIVGRFLLAGAAPKLDQAVLERLLVRLRAEPRAILVLTGHTDSIGPPATNMRLGLERARAIRSELIDAGAPGERIRVESSGESQPLVREGSPQGRAKNRRVEASWRHLEPK